MDLIKALNEKQLQSEKPQVKMCIRDRCVIYEKALRLGG